MVAAQDLKSCPERGAGSSPAEGIMYIKCSRHDCFENALYKVRSLDKEIYLCLTHAKEFEIVEPFIDGRFSVHVKQKLIQESN